MQEFIKERQHWPDVDYDDDFDVYLSWPSLQAIIISYNADTSVSSSRASSSALTESLYSETPRLVPYLPLSSISSIDLNIDLAEVNSQQRGIDQAGYNRIFSLGFFTVMIHRHIALRRAEFTS